MAILTCGYDKTTGAAKTYTTIASAIAAASAGDTIVLHRSKSSGARAWDSGSPVTINKAITLQAESAGIGFVSVVVGVTVSVSGVTLNGLSFSVAAQQVGVLFTAASGTLTVAGCRFYAGSGGVYSTAANTTLNVVNCLFVGPLTVGAVNTNQATCVINVDNCTAAFGTYGFLRTTGTYTVRNSLAFDNLTSDFSGTMSGSNNAALDGTAPGASPLDLSASEASLAIDFARLDYRLLLDGSALLLQGGVNVGLTADIDGNAYPGGQYPIGCSAGVKEFNPAHRLTTATPAGTYVPPAAADVRSGTNVGQTTGTLAVPAASNVLLGVAVDATTGTFDESARNTDPGIGNVFEGTAYKIANAAKIGTLSAATVLTPKGTFDKNAYAAAYEAGRNSGLLATDLRDGVSAMQLGVTVDGSCAVPAAADVRAGVAVDAGIGTAAIPDAGDVRYGVEVDDTFGTLEIGTVPVLLTGNLLEAGSSWLDGQRKTHMSSNITYARGGESALAKAQIGRTLFQAPDINGLVVSTESKDFIVSSLDIATIGEPAAGDTISYLGNTYEVMAPQGEPVWRWSDLYNNTMRIHTKLIVKA